MNKITVTNNHMFRPKRVTISLYTRIYK